MTLRRQHVLKLYARDKCRYAGAKTALGVVKCSRSDVAFYVRFECVCNGRMVQLVY